MKWWERTKKWWRGEASSRELKLGAVKRPQPEWQDEYSDYLDEGERITYGIKLIGYFDKEGTYGITWHIDCDDGTFNPALVVGDLAYVMHVFNEERAGMVWADDDDDGDDGDDEVLDGAA